MTLVADDILLTIWLKSAGNAYSIQEKGLCSVTDIDKTIEQ